MRIIKRKKKSQNYGKIAKKKPRQTEREKIGKEKSISKVMFLC